MMSLQEYIDSKGIDAEVIQLKQAMPTVEAAAQALGTDEGSIVKSLLFQGETGEVVLVVACGKSKVDTKKVAAVAGIGRLKLAPLKVVQEQTGYAVGGVPPIGHKRSLTVLVDEKVLQRERVFGGGGWPQLLLSISPQDIVSVVEGIVGEFGAQE